MFISETWFYAIVGVVAVIGVALLLVLIAPEPADATDISVPPQEQHATVPEVPVVEEQTPAQPAAPEVTSPTPSTVVSTEPSVAYALDGIVADGEYRNLLDADGFQVHWMNDSAVLRVGLVSPGAGFLAIGFDPDRRMKGANYILGAVNGIAISMRDDYGTGTTSHAADTSQGGTHDILEAAGREINGGTMLEFSIPLDSGDPLDKPLEPGLTYQILVAYHMMNDSFSAKHSRRGAGEIRLDPAP